MKPQVEADPMYRIVDPVNFDVWDTIDGRVPRAQGQTNTHPPLSIFLVDIPKTWDGKPGRIQRNSVTVSLGPDRSAGSRDTMGGKGGGEDRFGKLSEKPANNGPCMGS